MQTQGILLLALFAVLLIVWGIYSLCSQKKVTLTGRATVKSRYTQLARGRKYLICFELSDGSTVELRTIRSDYETLKDGQSGQVTWEDDLLLHFDPDPTP